MTDKSGLAAGQLLMIGAGGALLGLLAVLYASGGIDKDVPPSQTPAQTAEPAISAPVDPAPAEPTAADPTAPVAPVASVALPTEDPSEETPPKSGMSEAALAQPDVVARPEAPNDAPVKTEDAPEATASDPAAEPSIGAADSAGMEPKAEADTDTDPQAADLPKAPRFDVVRIEADGSTLVAGVAQAGSEIDILLDQEVIGTTAPGADGKFAAFLEVPPSDQPRLMTLMLRTGEMAVASRDQVIIAPAQVQAQVQELAEVQATQADTQAGPQTKTQTEDQAAPQVAAVTAQQAQADPGSTIAEPAVAAKDPVADPAADPASGAVAPEMEAQTQDAPAVNTASDPAAADTGLAAPDPVAPVVIIANDDGINLVQPAQVAAAPTAFLLDAISYDDRGDVELAGRGQSGGGLRAYLDNALQGSAKIGAAGQWRLVLRDVAPGIYTLRIDQLDAEGKVSARVETPFKRETPERVVAGQSSAASGEAGGATSAATAADPEATAPNSTVQTTAAPLAAVAAVAGDPGRAPIRAVTVQPGSTLWAIARDTYGDGVLYVRVFQANRDLIRDPDLIYPGQVFNLPE